MAHLKDRRSADRVLMEKPRRRSGDNIKMDFREVGWCMDRIYLARNRDRWWAVLNAVINLRFP
jgi:hypothetical protein